MNKGRPREFDETDVLERVMNSFWRHGYENTTFEHLVSESGLSRSSLYNTFGGKDELFKKAMELYSEQEIEEFLHQLTDPESGGEYLRTLTQTFREPFDPRSKGCLSLKTILGNAAAGKGPSSERRIPKMLTKFWQAYQTAIANLKPKRTKPKPISLKEKAAVLLAIKFGIAVIARNGRNKDLVDSITDGTAKLLED